MPRASAWVGVAAAVVLAGCGEAEVTGPRAATSPTIEAGAPSVEAMADAGPDAPAFGTPSVSDKPVADSELDPYGLDAAMDRFELTPALEACAGDPSCPEHAEARFFEAMIAVEGGMLDALTMEIPESYQRAQDAVAREWERVQFVFEDNPETTDDFERRAQMHNCLQNAAACEGTPLEAQSAGGEFDAYRAAVADQEQATTAYSQNAHNAVQERLSAFMDTVETTAHLGSPSANVILGMAYAESFPDMGVVLPVERNDGLAVGHLIAATDAGSAEGAYSLAQMIHVGRAGPVRDVDALLRTAFERGLPEAGQVLAARLRARGETDPDLPAPDAEGDPLTLALWDYHPDKPDTHMAMEAAMSGMSVESYQGMLDSTADDDGTAKVFGLVDIPEEPPE